MRTSSTATNDLTAGLSQFTSAERFAYQQLRDRILLQRHGDTPVRSLLVTSARPREGTSTIVGCLALTFANSAACRGVLVVDTCSDRPQQQKLFGIHRTPGLSEFLEGDCPAAEVIKFTAVERVHVLPVGAAELRILDYQARFQEWLRGASEEYDAVIIDAPSVSESTIPEAVASLVDGVVLVVRSGHSPRDVVNDAFQRLAVAGGRILGVAMQNYVEHVPAVLRRRLSV